jgi:hypothetical protein
MLLSNKNFSYSVLAAQLLVGDGSLTVTTGQGTLFPASNFLAVLWTGTSPLVDTTREIVLCTTRTTDVLTITRAQEGTSAKQWETGTYIAHILTAGKLDELENQIALLGSPDNFALNGSFEGWSAPAVGPDSWDVSSLVVAQTTSLSHRLLSCQATSLLSTVGRLSQTLNPDLQGVRGTYDWTFNVDILCSVASRVRAFISYPDGGGGTVYTYSTYHTGGGAKETLSVTKSLLTSSAAIGKPTFGVEVSSGVAIVVVIDSAMFTPGRTPRLFKPSVYDHHGKYSAPYPNHFEAALVLTPGSYLDLPVVTNLGFCFLTTTEVGTDIIHHTLFSHSANAVITPLLATSRIVFTDLTGSLSIFDNGSQIRIKNNTANNAYTVIKGWYW